jgi:hypothetical protein
MSQAGCGRDRLGVRASVRESAAPSRPTPGGATTRVERRRRGDADRHPRAAQQRTKKRGREDLPSRGGGKPGQGAVRQGRHGLALEPALADVRRLRGPLRAGLRLRRAGDARTDASRNARPARWPAIRLERDSGLLSRLARGRFASAAVCGPRAGEESDAVGLDLAREQLIDRALALGRGSIGDPD